MKTSHFVLDNPVYHDEAQGGRFKKYWATYYVPTLYAYSIVNHSIDGLRRDIDGEIKPIETAIVDNQVIIYGVDSFFDKVFPSKPILTIYHFGIEDYSYLFPSINNTALRVRIGQLMEECEKSFDNGSWLAFSVMAGGVLEGLFSDILKDYDSTLGRLISKVEELCIFEEYDIETARNANEIRCLIHAGQYSRNYVERKDAMRIRIALDKFIKMDWKTIIKDIHDSQE